MALFINISVILWTSSPGKIEIQEVQQVEQELTALDKIQQNCIVQALYHEARGEGSAGVLAVATVIQNRVLSGKYPDNYCDTIHQRKQFSFVHERKSSGLSLTPSPTKQEVEMFEFIQDTAKSMVKFEFEPTLDRSVLWYAHKDITNAWIRKKHKVVQINNHIFYK